MFSVCFSGVALFFMVMWATNDVTAMLVVHEIDLCLVIFIVVVGVAVGTRCVGSSRCFVEI